MSLQFTGNQMRALLGLLQNQGLSAPFIQPRLDLFRSLAAVDAYEQCVSLLPALPVWSTLDTISAQVQSVWQPDVSYADQHLVLYQGQVYQAQGEVAGAAEFQSEPSWELQPLEPYVTHQIDWSLLPTAEPPVWLRSSQIRCTSPGAQFSADWRQVQLSAPLVGSASAEIQLNLHKIFYTSAEQMPALLGATPQQFVQFWGDGPCISRAYARTQQLLPAGTGGQVLAHVLGQSQAYAQSVAPVQQAASQCQWGITSRAADMVTAGWSLLVGSDQSRMQQLGLALQRSAALINLQQPAVSFSACQVFWYLSQQAADIVGNAHVHVIGQTVTDPVTGQLVTISSEFLNAQVQQNHTVPLRNTGLDQQIADLAQRRFSTADVQVLADYLGVLTPADQLRTFADLINPVLALASTAQHIQQHTGIADAVQALMLVLPQIQISSWASTSEVGAAVAQIQTLDQSPALAAAAVPVTEPEFLRLLRSLGTGAAAAGRLRAADCVGNTQYELVLNNTIAVLQRFQLTSGEPEPGVLSMRQNLLALKQALEQQDATQAVLSNALEIADAGDWLLLVTEIKNLLDQQAQRVRDICEQQGWDALLSAYNQLAETHNTSTYIRTAAGIIYSTGYTSPDTTTTGVQSQERQVAEPDQQVFELADISYTPGSNDLTVFVSGILQLPEQAYTETNSNTVTFSEPVPAGAEVLFETLSVVTTAPADEFTPLGTAQSRPQLISLVRSLAQWGTDADDFQAQSVIEPCCENNITGDSIRAVLRESRNFAILEQAGVSNTSLSARPLGWQPPASAADLIGAGQRR